MEENNKINIACKSNQELLTHWERVGVDVCVFTLMCVPARCKQTDIMKCVISHNVSGLLIEMQTTRAPEMKQAFLDLSRITFGLLPYIPHPKCVGETSKQNDHVVSAQIKSFLSPDSLTFSSFLF